MNKCLVFALIAMTSINVVVTSTTTNPEPICVPWLGKVSIIKSNCITLNFFYIKIVLH